jgi:hypothetical protein
MGRFAYIKSSVRTPFFEEPFLHQVALTWLHQVSRCLGKTIAIP